jgi:transcriptional regulator with XRE-family HTH domain
MFISIARMGFPVNRVIKINSSVFLRRVLKNNRESVILPYHERDLWVNTRIGGENMRSVHSEKFSELIKRVLKERGLSYTKASALVGVSNTYVQQWVEAGKVPSEMILERILRAFPEIGREELYQVAYSAQMPEDPVEAVRLALSRSGLSPTARETVLSCLKEELEAHRPGG